MKYLISPWKESSSTSLMGSDYKDLDAKDHYSFLSMVSNMEDNNEDDREILKNTLNIIKSSPDLYECLREAMSLISAASHVYGGDYDALYAKANAALNVACNGNWGEK